MKKMTFTLLGIVVLSLAIAQELAVNYKPINKLNAEAAFNWTATEYDFGQIKQGQPVSYEFMFTNSGDVPLIISTVQASCGCTITSYTKDPIEPGQNGTVTATYNASGLGQFNKTVTVNANTADGIARLTIKGEVVQ